MRKNTTTLTYRGDKMPTSYKDHKKNFYQKKWHLDFFDELCYIVSCLYETVRIIGSHYMKKIPRIKK